MHAQGDNFDAQLTADLKEAKKTKEPILILVFANKGGVGKTTSTHNIGYLLADKLGANVLMADFDGQCNLTGSCLRKHFLKEEAKERTGRGESEQEDKLQLEPESETKSISEEEVIKRKQLKNDLRVHREFMKYYDDDKYFIAPFMPQIDQSQRILKQRSAEKNNLFRILYWHDTLTDSQVPDFIKTIVPHDLRPYFSSNWKGGKLSLLPGSMNIGQLERLLMDAALSPSKATRANFFRPTDLLRQVAKKHDMDIVLIDVNPGTSLVNHSLWVGSNYFMIPTEPSMYSAQSVATIGYTIASWALQARSIWGESNLAYSAEKLSYPKFLGVYVQKIPYSPGKEGGTNMAEAIWIKTIEEVVKDVLLPLLKGIDNVIDDPADKSKLGKISEFDRSRRYCEDEGLPIAAYQHGLESPTFNKKNIDLKNCIRYEDEFLMLIDLLMGKDLLKHTNSLSLAVRSHLQLSAVDFDKNYRELRRQLRNRYKTLPYPLKLSETDEQFISHLLYDYSADDMEKVLFSLREFKPYQNQASVFIGCPAFSLQELERLLDDKFLNALKTWHKPNQYIFVFYAEQKWHTIRIFLEFNRPRSSLSILFKSPDDKNIDYTNLGELLKKFIKKLFPRTVFEAELLDNENFNAEQLDQLKGRLCSGIVALRNIMDYIEHGSKNNLQFIESESFSISGDSKSITEQQIAARNQAKQNLKATHTWLVSHNSDVIAKQEVILLQELFDNFYSEFEKGLPEKADDIEKIYVNLDRPHRFIPDSLQSHYQLACLMMLLEKWYRLVGKCSTKEGFQMLSIKRDDLFSSSNADSLFSSLGAYLNWFYAKKYIHPIMAEKGKLGHVYGSSNRNQFVEWQEYRITDDIGSKSNSDDVFSVLGVSRKEVVNILLSQINNEAVRGQILFEELIEGLHLQGNIPSYLQGENLSRYFEKDKQFKEKVENIYKYYKEKRALHSKLCGSIYSALQESKTELPKFSSDPEENILEAIKQNKLPNSLKSLSDQFVKVVKELQEFKRKLAADKELFTSYINFYAHDKGLWLGLPSMLVIAKEKGMNLRIWRPSGKKIGDLSEIVLEPPVIGLPQALFINVVALKGGRFNFLVDKRYSAQPSTSPRKESEKDQRRSEKVETHIGFDRNEQPILFHENWVSGVGGNCGFNALDMIRSRVVEILLSKVNDRDARKLICDEIIETLQYHKILIKNGERYGEKPPTHYMDEKLQPAVDELVDKINLDEKNILDGYDKIRNKMDELKIESPPTRTSKYIDEYIQTDAKRLHPEIKLLATDLQTAKNQKQQTYHQLCDNPNIYTQYVQSYIHESGLWLGKGSMRIVAEVENIRIHVWGLTRQQTADLTWVCFQDTYERLNAPPPTRILNVLFNGSHFSLLTRMERPMLSSISSEDDIFRLSILTSRRDDLINKFQTGTQHSSLDKELDQVLSEIARVEARLNPSAADRQDKDGRKRLREDGDLSTNIAHSVYAKQSKHASTAGSQPRPSS